MRINMFVNMNNIVVEINAENAEEISSCIINKLKSKKLKVWLDHYNGRDDGRRHMSISDICVDNSQLRIFFNNGIRYVIPFGSSLVVKHDKISSLNMKCGYQGFTMEIL